MPIPPAVHTIKQGSKEGTQSGEEHEVKCNCQECAQGEEVLKDGERYLEDESKKGIKSLKNQLGM